MTHTIRSSISRNDREKLIRLQSKTYISVVILCLWVLTAGWGYAQSSGRGNITGTVTDPGGAVVVGAQITRRQHRDECHFGFRYQRNGLL